jgi:hypothetical protein
MLLNPTPKRRRRKKYRRSRAPRVVRRARRALGRFQRANVRRARAVRRGARRIGRRIGRAERRALRPVRRIGRKLRRRAGRFIAGKRRRSSTRRRNTRVVVATSNPIGGVSTFVENSLMPAAVGALGALGVSFVVANVPLPASLNTPQSSPLVKIAIALALGAAAGMIVSEEVGEQVAAGGLTVTLYGVMTTWVQQNAPNVQLARYVGAYRPRHLGRNVMSPNGVLRGRLRRPKQQPGIAGLGYVNAARTLGRYVK